MIETQLEVLYLVALLLLVDCICCVIAAYRKNPTLGAVAGGGRDCGLACTCWGACGIRKNRTLRR